MNAVLVPPAWATVAPARTLLVVVRTGTTLGRLLDVLTLTAADHRIQTVFTHDPDHPPIFAAGTAEFLNRLQAPVISWSDAAATRFDLAIAASENDRLHELDAPILLIPHGLGFHKYYPGGTTISGMNPDRLVHEGRVVPAAIALTHPDELSLLATTCPPAVPHAVVVGDPSLDRMLAARHRVPAFRAALGARGRTLAVLASTWGPDSLLGRFPDLPERLAAALPVDEYAIAAILHPGIWSAHGPWQVRAWLSRATASGVRVIPPESGWQATLTAADLVVSDAGSLSLYAALLGKPLLLTPGGPTVVPDTAIADLLTTAPRLAPDRDLLPQIKTIPHGYAVPPAVDTPGTCAPRLRSLIYRLLDLAEPATPAELPPPPAPVSTDSAISAYVVDAPITDGIASLRRFPATLPSPPEREPADHRHTLADLRHATHGQLAGATIIHTASRHDAAALLATWPSVALVTTTDREGHCHAVPRTGPTTTLTADGCDPTLLASLAYLRLRQPGLRTDVFRIGDRLIPVTSSD
ncbi:hypothetical protein J2S43_003903 [Catenuloplanes nepalensis]|uniref:Uncharacterized protein n=1 Tax=Catenuloplanes nepalensis TaxID=587533 RepID=A0ABT9MVV2_9ACTN|nr:hypothetical protein [Catenuloplanes nepalensis]MDP9795391.1 hypothetical protein [Catenuloplanes nepalensis]